ncbi:MAG TPA: SelB C-terminal domain-containing protein [Candidatus Baltobacteraceae bacterium]
MGATSLALARELRAVESELVPALAGCIAQGLVVQRDGYYRTPDFQPELTAEQRSFFDAAIAVDPAAPFLPAARDAVFEAIAAAEIAGLSRALDTLLATGELAGVAGSLYRREQIAWIRALLDEFLARQGRITVAQFRDLLGSTRRFAVPLLEWFDARGITAREGDDRVATNCGS